MPLSAAGYQVGFIDANGSAIFVAALSANGTIPARGAYLVAGPNYSLLGLAAPDLQVLPLPFASIGGVAVFDGLSANPATRLDSVAYNSVPANSFLAYFREGLAPPSPGATTVEHSWMRKLANGLPQDTNNFKLFLTNSVNGLLSAKLWS